MEKTKKIIREDEKIRKYLKKGYSIDWINKRLRGQIIRRNFVSCLKEHGVLGDGFCKCTMAIYKYISNRGNYYDENFRDTLNISELELISKTEQLATELINKKNAQGLLICISICLKASKKYSVF